MDFIICHMMGIVGLIVILPLMIIILGGTLIKVIKLHCSARSSRRNLHFLGIMMKIIRML